MLVNPRPETTTDRSRIGRPPNSWSGSMRPRRQNLRPPAVPREPKFRGPAVCIFNARRNPDERVTGALISFLRRRLTKRIVSGVC